MATIEEIREHVATGRPAAVPVGWVSLLLNEIDRLTDQNKELDGRLWNLEAAEHIGGGPGAGGESVSEVRREADRHRKSANDWRRQAERLEKENDDLRDDLRRARNRNH